MRRRREESRRGRGEGREGREGDIHLYSKVTKKAGTLGNFTDGHSIILISTMDSWLSALNGGNVIQSIYYIVVLRSMCRR